jgi:bifunctional UDP-N-acetylglucosamine pyrophosphorylase / glucosamine-1-phosphate N-acetyltransferase
MKKDFDIVILAAGKGTRMGLAKTPKVLVPLRGKPLISYLLDGIAREPSLAAPIVVVGFKSEEVKSLLGRNYLYALQEQQLGTGHAVVSAMPQVTGQHFMVLYGDMPFIKTASIVTLGDLHMKSGSVLSMFTVTVPNFDPRYESMNNYGRIIRDNTGQIIKITEYKDATTGERHLREVNPGIYTFQRDWFVEHAKSLGNKNAQGEYYLTDMVEIAIGSGQRIVDISISPEEVLGINTPEQLKAAEEALGS